MNNKVKSLEVNGEFLNSHSAVPFTLNKKTTGEYIYSWNIAPRFFPDDMKDAPIRIKYLMDNSHKVGLDDLAMPDQPTGDKLIEDCHEITYEDFVEYFNSDVYKKQGTIWNVDKNYNSIFMKKDVHDRVLEEFGRGVSLVFPAADCAVVRFYDKNHNVIGLTHSDAAHTTGNIIGKSIAYMKERFNTSIDDLEVYISAFASDGWTYDSLPSFASNGEELNDEWKHYVVFRDDKYLINYGDKIYDQLEEAGIDMNLVFFDPDNTLFNDDYFSNSRSYNSRVDGIPTYREGRNMMGITFDTDELVRNADENNVILR